MTSARPCPVGASNLARGRALLISLPSLAYSDRRSKGARLRAFVVRQPEAGGVKKGCTPDTECSTERINAIRKRVHGTKAIALACAAGPVASALAVPWACAASGLKAGFRGPKNAPTAPLRCLVYTNRASGHGAGAAGPGHPYTSVPAPAKSSRYTAAPAALRPPPWRGRGRGDQCRLHQ